MNVRSILKQQTGPILRSLSDY